MRAQLTEELDQFVQVSSLSTMKPVSSAIVRPATVCSTVFVGRLPVVTFEQLDVVALRKCVGRAQARDARADHRDIHLASLPTT